MATVFKTNYRNIRAVLKSGRHAAETISFEFFEKFFSHFELGTPGDDPTTSSSVAPPQGQSKWPIRQYDWKEENILQATKVWFRHIHKGGKPRGPEWYNVSDVYKNYPKAVAGSGAFGSSHTSRGWAGILITINNTNPDYYSANYIGGISFSSQADLDANVYRIWAKHPTHNNSVISVSFNHAKDYERWRKYIIGN